jgi:hypothetical protein
VNFIFKTYKQSQTNTLQRVEPNKSASFLGEVITREKSKESRVSRKDNVSAKGYGI